MSPLSLAAPPIRSIAERTLRRLTIGLSLLGALVALAMAISDEGRRASALQTAQDLGLPGTSLPSGESGANTLADDLARLGDAHRAGLLVARAVVAFELEPGRWQRIAPADVLAERDASRARLARAEALAREAVLARPADWQAPMLLGAARYLHLLADRDMALVWRTDLWEGPLQTARRRGPAFGEASRLLTAGYLEIWPMLSKPARAQARAVLEEAFADAATFDRFFPAWAKLARGRDELYQPLPDRAAVWHRVAAHHAEKADWPAWLVAYGRAEKASRAELETTLAEARARAAGGDTNGALRLFVTAAQAVSPSLANAARFEAAIRERPAGPIGDALSSVSRDWLGWAVPLCRLGPCPLAPDTFARLAAAPGLYPEDVATALLLSDDLSAAERRERREESQWSEAWASYMLLKARQLTAHGDREGTREALAVVNRTWRQRLPTLLARAEAARLGVDLAARGAAEAALAAARRDSWESTDWFWRGPAAQLEMLPSRAARALHIALLDVPAKGAVVDLQWNGRALPPQVVAHGQTSMSVEVEGGEEPSLLRLRSLAGGTVRPGRVDLASSDR